MNISSPCRATIRLAIQSGTLVPAARKVMPMMTSGIPRVKLIMVTYAETGRKCDLLISVLVEGCERAGRRLTIQTMR